MNLKIFTLIVILLVTITGAAAEEGRAGKVAHIPIPAGYEELKYEKGSFSSYIQNLKLKEKSEILNHKGGRVESFYKIFYVIDLPLLFSADLEQCADYAMRLWAEYYKDSANLKNLYLFNYDGSRTHFNSGGMSYEKFLFQRFSYSNSYSLKMGGSKIVESQLRPGDLIVQNETGGIGHVSIIFNICRNQEGEQLYLIGYSFMPAQEIHIERATSRYGKAGWFTLEGYYRYLAEYLPYGKPLLRRF